jgi:rod shape-determining protein MreC
MLLIFSGILMLLSSAQSPLIELARTQATDILTPLLSKAAIPVHGAAAFVRDVSGLATMQNRIAALENENAKLREWYDRAVYLQNENNSLRGLLQVTPEAAHEFVTARVVSDAGNAYVKTLLVAAGSEDGVEKGQAVLSANGLIGRILEVGRKSARVLLVTDINSRVPVIIQGTEDHAILAGTNDGLPALRHLPPGHKAPEGAMIMTSGHGGIFPAGLPLGKVSMGKENASRGSVDLFSDFSSLSYVKIINNKVDPNLKTGILTP